MLFLGAIAVKEPLSTAAGLIAGISAVGVLSLAIYQHSTCCLCLRFGCIRCP
ncbi:hypothetical protein [Candidatus Pyrohabitans sp.]